MVDTETESLSVRFRVITKLVGISFAVQTETFSLEKASVEKASVADIHARMKDGKLTARRLIEMHLERIDAYDKKGPALNAVILVSRTAP